MPYVPLHHKYRPQTFAQLVGQSAIATTLSSALAQERIAPAYLFTGARGTGKTSSARIFAKSLNCIATDKPTAEPCGRCQTCVEIAQGNALDVIEIDAASNTGVDNIRELIERAQFAPVQCRYKVYVIDECLTGDSLVLTQDGWQRIDDSTIKGKQVLSYNEASQRWEWKKAVRWLVRGKKPTLTIKTDQREIRCTENHLIRTAQGWQKAQNLLVGDRILSPANAAAENLSKNTAQIDASAALSEGINLRATNSAAKITTWPTSWLKPNLYGQNANVDVVKNSTSHNISSRKEKAWWQSSLTGDGILTAKTTDFGKSELKTLFTSWAISPTENMGLSTALYWEMEPLVTPIAIADFLGWLGLTDHSRDFGWSIKPVACQVSKLSSLLQQIKGMVTSPILAVAFAIQIWLKSTKWLDLIITVSKSVRNGWSKLPQRAWLGGTWTMALSASQPQAQLKFSCIQKGFQSQKTSFWQSGLQDWAIQLNAVTSSVVEPIKNFSTLPWGLKLHTNGWQTSVNTPFQAWTTNFETVKSIEIGIVEPVFDLEVEDNHNFVANGLLVHNCHMLSNAAFNSLLKTLEEPPERVVFVLATTDPQRVLPTIISRCQRFDFRRIPLDAMTAHLTTIAQTEEITAADDAIQLIGQISQGGLRDAESLLDQLSLLADGVTIEAVWDLVGAVPERDLLTLVEAIFSNNAEATIDTTRKLMDRGREPLIVLQNLASFYRDLLIAKTAADRNDLVAVTASTWEKMVQFAKLVSGKGLLAGQQHLRAAEVQLKNSTQPRLWLEITLLGLLPAALGESAVSTAGIIRTNTPTRSSQLTNPTSTPEAAPRPVEPVALIPIEPPTPIEPAISTPDPSPAAIPEPPEPIPTAPASLPSQNAPIELPPSASDTTDLDRTWQEILHNLGLASTKSIIAPNCFLMEVNGNTIKIGVRGKQVVPLVKGQLEKLSKACAKTLNIKSVKMNLVVTDNAPPVSSNAAPPNPQSGLKQPENPPAGSPRPPITQPPAPPKTTPPAAAKAPPAPPTDPVSPTDPNHWTPDDPVTRAAKSLADAFNGEIVNLQEEAPIVIPTDGEVEEPIVEDLPNDDDPPSINVPF